VPEFPGPPGKEEITVAVSKAQQKAVTKYVKSKYDRFGLTMPKGNLDTVKAHAEAQGQSINAYINAAIDSRMAQEATGGPQEAGVVSLPSDTLKAAQEAAKAAGEALPVFVARAVGTQADRDALGRKMKGGKTE